ncbi:S8 family serine peptidase [bacterium]|nr:S8 family serine peptidase [bacterium]
MSRRTRTVLALVLSALTAATAGCGLGGASGVSPTAHQLSSAGKMPAGTYSTRRVLVSFKAGQEAAGKESLKARLGMRVVQDMPQLGMSVLALPAAAQRESAMAAIAAQPAVTSVEADVRMRAGYRPQDPQSSLGSFSGLYVGFRSALFRAWDATLGDPRVVVAVVDTGVDITHPDLRDRVVTGRNFVTQIEEDQDDGTTKLVDLPDKGPLDDNGHGTHVAGIIAAAENLQGITGMAPRCKIMPIKSLAYNESGFSSDVAMGVVWAVDHGAHVINMSLGAYGGSKALEKAVAYALSKNVTVVAAMGNDRADADAGFGLSPSYPAALPGVIAVGATDGDDKSAYFSNAGRWISVSAPGDGILSTTPTYPVHGFVAQDYDEMSGTSMATPFVAGLTALMLSLTPNLTPQQLKGRLEASADDVGTPGFDTATGHGRINPMRALGMK